MNLRSIDEQRVGRFDARAQLALAISRQREALHLTQAELGARLKTSQPRVAKIERAAPNVSLDQLVRAFTAAGGTVEIRTKLVGRKSVKSPVGKKA